MKTYPTYGITIRRVDLGEKDRILTVYTKEYGKLSAVAKGCRRPGSKLAGPSEPLVHSKMLFAKGRDLDILTQAEVRDSFPAIRTNMGTVAHALYLLELVDKFTEEKQPNPELFDLLLSALYVLEAGTNPELATRYFELHLLNILGYEPHFETCLKCGKVPATKRIAFSPSMGGMLCKDCCTVKDAIWIPPALASYVRVLKNAEPNILVKLDFPFGARCGLARVLGEHIRYRLESSLKSTEFLRKWKRIITGKVNCSG
ncbi:MAG: DNA repair protein RecO [Armatimonadota bacterium]